MDTGTYSFIVNSCQSATEQYTQQSKTAKTIKTEELKLSSTVCIKYELYNIGLRVIKLQSDR